MIYKVHTVSLYEWLHFNNTLRMVQLALAEIMEWGRYCCSYAPKEEMDGQPSWNFMTCTETKHN